MDEVFKIELNGLLSFSKLESAIKKAINQQESSENRLVKFNMNEFNKVLKETPGQLKELAGWLDQTGKSTQALTKLQEKVDAQNYKKEIERLKAMKAAIKLATASKLTQISTKLLTKSIDGLRNSFKDLIKTAKVAALSVAGMSAIIGGITLIVNKVMDKISGSIAKAITAMPTYRLTRAEFDALQHTEAANSTDGGLADVLKSFNKALNNYETSGDFAMLGLNREKYLSMPSGKDAYMAFLEDVQSNLVSLPDSNPYKTTKLQSLDSITGGQSDFLRGILKNQLSNGKVTEGMLPQIKADFEEYTKIFNSVDYKKQNEASRIYKKSISDLTVAFDKLVVAISPVVTNILKAVSTLLSSKKMLALFNEWAEKIQKWATNTDFEQLFKQAFEVLERIFYIIKWMSDKFGFSGGGAQTQLATATQGVEKSKTEFIPQTRNERDESLHKMTSSFLGSYGKTKPVVNNVNVNINQDLKSNKNQVSSTMNDKPIAAGVTIRSK